MTTTDFPDLFSSTPIVDHSGRQRMDQARAASKPVARRSDPETSHAAADLAAPRAEKHRNLALRVLREHPEGLDDFRLAELTGVAQTSIGCRRHELVNLGLVRWSGERGKSPSGASCRIWVAV